MSYIFKKLVKQKIVSELQKSTNSDNVEIRPFMGEEVKVNEVFPPSVDGSNLVATSEKESSVLNRATSYNGSSIQVLFYLKVIIKC